MAGGEARADLRSFLARPVLRCIVSTPQAMSVIAPFWQGSVGTPWGGGDNIYIYCTTNPFLQILADEKGSMCDRGIGAP